MRTKLTPEQIAEATRLRFGREKMAWRKIGARLGCDNETLQRILTPGFAQERAAQKLSTRLLKDARAAEKFRKTLRAPDVIDDDEDTRPMRVRIMDQDTKFQAALRTAILRNEESCVEGICETPQTERPIFCSLHVEPSSGMRSPAALCAELGS